jgi:hypothetical protein
VVNSFRDAEGKAGEEARRLVEKWKNTVANENGSAKGE